MEHKEKQIAVTTITNTLILAGYSLYIYKNYIENDFTIINDFTFWGRAFLILIPVSIVAQIIIQIVFSILNKIVTNEDLQNITDERDRLIELKAIKISHWTFIFGFMLSMGSQAIGMQIWVMFMTLILSGFISSIVDGLAKIYFYRKGF